MDLTSFVPLMLLVTAAGSSVPREAAPLAHTFSIVARDSATGEMGVAVQSHYFSVGPIVPWAEAGVGAVATQSLVLVDYGPKGLDLMRQGLTAPQALAALVKIDSNPGVRQVAMIDAKGNVAAHTGPMCIPDAGQHVGSQYSTQANLMANDRVWPAMAAAYEKAHGDLAERMLQALEAGEKAGGDIRGRQSAAIVIVRAQTSGKPWQDRVIDLRVEDHPDPIKELRRLVRLRRAYNLEDQGDNFIADRKPEQALAAYAAAAKLAPEIVELQFCAAVSMYTNGREQQALETFRGVFAREGKRWVDLVPRIAKAGLFPDQPEKIAQVQKQWSGFRGKH
ncbi:MAG: DUF1028 domain-containing protein [Candidatus Eisenbacteria bacterium]|uniref:DUF1028 domain-containing protein n=1 Tax=Eiseniibacteriota bacterium TaxID=2212470 RepID=A0A538U7K4_UNCEI|nr:MAG: DUF1028 domain-containing protein [Candidatus Eisenbacteria bacterium]